MLPCKMLLSFFTGLAGIHILKDEVGVFFILVKYFKKYGL